MGAGLDLETGSIVWASGGGSSLPNTPNRLINTDASGNPDDSRLYSEEININIAPGVDLTGQGLGAVGINNIDLAFVDASAVGGAHTALFRTYSGESALLAMTNIDTFQNYWLLTKGVDDVVAFQILPDGSTPMFTTDSNGVTLGAGATVDAVLNSLTNETDKIPTSAAVFGAIEAITLNSLTDVDTSGVSDGDALVFDSGSSLWVPAAITASPGGSDTQIQYNDGGAFGGTNLAYNDSALTWTMTNTAFSSPNSKTLLNLTDDHSDSALKIVEEKAGSSTHTYKATLGYYHNTTSGTQQALYSQESTGDHIFRGAAAAVATSALTIRLDSGNNQRIIATNLYLEPTGGLNLNSGSISMDASVGIGHGSFGFGMNGSNAMFIHSSNNNRRIAVGNGVSNTVASKQFHVLASATTYSAITAKGFSTSTSVPILEVLNSADVELMGVGRLAMVINETGLDYDFRIEGDTATNLFLADASLDAIQIGTTSAGVIADFRSSAIVFNEDGADRDFRVEGDTDANNIFSDASTDRVGIGTNAPNSKLDVNGTIQADGLRLDVTPTTEVIVPTDTITVSINGTNYKIPIVAA